MHRADLLDRLKGYEVAFPEEAEVVFRFKEFVEHNPACFERSSEVGHVTGSAFVLSPDLGKVLLTHHAKLRKWLQLGGHADGCPYVHEVALKEAVEESGLKGIAFFPGGPLPIDIDIHEIPPSKDVGSHVHYDVRYVFRSPDMRFLQSAESLALKWVALDEVTAYSNEGAVLRAIRKIQNMRSEK